jgi:hypothetical protein
MNRIMIGKFAVFLALTFCVPALAEPWAASGQTNLAANSSVDNPAPADTGAIGAVADLPYMVPFGYTLCVDHMAMEGYDSPGIAVLFLFTGSYPGGATSADRISHGTGSVAASTGSTEHTGRFCFPEGVTINVRLINGQSYSGVYGWQVTGELLGTP